VHVCTALLWCISAASLATLPNFIAFQEILKLNKVNGCNDISFGDHSILEGDRIIIIIIIIMYLLGC